MTKLKNTESYDIYTCVRHQKPRKDVGIVTLPLCEDCAKGLIKGGFNSAQPVYEGAPLNGWCCQCNLKKPNVKFRQWYLCGICERVTRSIGRGKVASSYLQNWWNENIAKLTEPIVLVETDAPILRSYGSNKGEESVNPDFIGFDKDINRELLTIELKAGRSPISGMSQFQLDTTDCDDILTVVKGKELPALVVHVQVVEQYDPPTSYFKGVGIWWTDIFRMAKAFKSCRRRQTEQRFAAYFDRKCFEPIYTLPDFISSDGLKNLKEMMEKDGIPELYSEV